MKKREVQLLVVGFVMGAFPQFISATNLKDLSEVGDTALGGSLATVVAIIYALTSKNERGRNE